MSWARRMRWPHRSSRTPPLTKLVRERIAPQNRRSARDIVLLVLGAPVWASLLLAAAAVLLAVYVCLWTVILSLWAVFAALALCALAGLSAGVVYAVRESFPDGIAIFGAGLVCAGLSILLFFLCRAASRGLIALTRKLAPWIKRCVMRKEDIQ